jgi:hypothetical protein
MYYRILNPETILINQDISGQARRPAPTIACRGDSPWSPGTTEPLPPQEQTQSQAQESIIEIPGLITPDGFVEKTFRVISRAVFFLDVDMTIPVDYTKEGVLTQGLQIFPEKLSIFQDHIPSVKYLCGHATNHQYITDTNPEGIDSLFRIDNKTNPDLARHVQTGTANSSSLTLLVAFSRSHDMKEKDFYESLGKVVDGSLVRFVAERLKRIYEVSLVWAGADPTAVAQKLDYYASKDPKSFHINQNPNTKKEEKSMDPEIKLLLETIKQKYGVDCATVSQAVAFLEKTESEKAALKQQVNALETQVSELKPFKETATLMLGALRDDVTRLHKLTAGMMIDALTMEVIKAASYEKLKEMQKSLSEKAEKAVPLKCQGCGSTNVTRLSSVDAPPQTPGTPGEKKTKFKPINIGINKHGEQKK